MFRESHDSLLQGEDPSILYLELRSLAAEANALMRERASCKEAERREHLWHRYLDVMVEWDSVHALFVSHNRKRLHDASLILRRWTTDCEWMASDLPTP